RHGKPRALDRKENGDGITDRIAGRGIGHHRPIGVPILAVVENATKREQIREVGEVHELHEIITCRSGELLQPNRGVYASQPVIKGDQSCIAPTWGNQVDEIAELFEAKQEEKMRIPVAPEMPEFLR